MGDPKASGDDQGTLNRPFSFNLIVRSLYAPSLSRTPTKARTISRLTSTALSLSCDEKGVKGINSLWTCRIGEFRTPFPFDAVRRGKRP